MTRDDVQQEALNALIKHNGGTVVLDTGVGKTKVALDFLVHTQIVHVIILVPRNNLKENWENEIIKWKFHKIKDNEYRFRNVNGSNLLFKIQIVTIQSVYETKLIDPTRYLIIADEIHTMASETYKQFFLNNKGAVLVGLTATPEDYKSDKAQFYRNNCPIIYTYKDAAKDNIINGRKYFILRTDLDKRVTTVPGWKYPVPEVEVLKYYNNKLKEAGEAIEEYFNTYRFTGNYYNCSSIWCYQKRGNPEQQRLGWAYLRAVQARKTFMLNQGTTVRLAKQIMTSHILEKQNILIFSNQISQIQKILLDNYIVHSKKKQSENEKIVFGFNQGVFRQMGSCEALEMGMNFKRANVAIFESYVGSSTKASQKMGRTDRLPVAENAIIIILYVNDSPFEGWYRKSGFPNFDSPNVTVCNSYGDLIKSLEQHVK